MQERSCPCSTRMTDSWRCVLARRYWRAGSVWNDSSWAWQTDMMWESVRKASIRRLLVREPNWIGDAVMSEPALAALRELFPTAEITLLVKPAIAELLRGHPALQRILVYEDPGRHVGITGKWTLAGTLRRLRFDLAILFQNAF